MVETAEMMAQRLDTEVVLKTANTILQPILQPLASNRYNASHKADRISSTVMTMCSRNTYSVFSMYSKCMAMCQAEDLSRLVREHTENTILGVRH